MGYQLLDPDNLAPTPEFPCDRRSISAPGGLSTLAAAIYTVQPDQQLTREYHPHEQREELFYVLAGTLHVRTPERTFEVEPDRVFFAGPDSPILPHVPETAPDAARVFGVGAPRYDPGRPYDPET
jgi:uncharacterized RmlC-like cupin family protein